MDRIEFLACLLSPQIVLNPPRNTAETFSVDVDLVNLYCTVRDAKTGAYIRDLRREDFELRDNGQRVELKAFSADVSAPLVLALLVDVSGSVASLVDVEKEAAGQFLKSVVRTGDRALIGTFASNVAIWQDFTGSLPPLLAALKRLDTTDFPGHTRRGGTLLYDAVSLTAEQRLPSQSGRKTMILITDGVDQGSIADLTRTARAAQLSDAVVYAIHYQENSTERHGVSALKKLCEPTGGAVFEMRKKLELQSIFDGIEHEMRSQYSLGFRPAPAQAERTFRKLEVKVRRPGVRVYARQGYYTAARGVQPRSTR